MNQLFQSFQRILGATESVDFTVRRHEKGLEVIVTPALKDTPTDLPKEDAEFRGALATPLYVCDEAGVLDARFFDQLAEYAEVRGSLASNCEAIDALREADKQAKVAKNKHGTKSGAGKSEVSAVGDDDKSNTAKTPETVPEPSVVTDKNPDDLFGART